MPALVKSSVGSFVGTSEELRTTRWPRSSKKRRNILRVSLPVRNLVTGALAEPAIIAKICHGGTETRRHGDTEAGMQGGREAATQESRGGVMRRVTRMARAFPSASRGLLLGHADIRIEVATGAIYCRLEKWKLLKSRRIF